VLAPFGCMRIFAFLFLFLRLLYRRQHRHTSLAHAFDVFDRRRAAIHQVLPRQGLLFLFNLLHHWIVHHWIVHHWIVHHWIVHHWIETLAFMAPLTPCGNYSGTEMPQLF